MPPWLPISIHRHQQKNADQYRRHPSPVTGPARAAARAGPTPNRPNIAGTLTPTTTSRSSTTQLLTVAPILRATTATLSQAEAAPYSARCAPASADRSAAACARCRATTAEPTAAPPAVSASSTTIIATATIVAEPSSALGFHRGNRFGGNRDGGQQPASRGNPRHHVITVAPNLDHCPARSKAVCDPSPPAFVTAGGQPCRLTRGVHTTHLHRHHLNTRRTQHEYRHQCCDTERGFDGNRSGVAR